MCRLIWYFDPRSFKVYLFNFLFESLTLKRLPIIREFGIINKIIRTILMILSRFLKRKGYHKLMLKNHCHTGYDDVNKRGDGDTRESTYNCVDKKCIHNWHSLERRLSWVDYSFDCVQRRVSDSDRLTLARC